ncbi:flavin reductase family protein [Lachnospiraceae bacterium 38-10]
MANNYMSVITQGVYVIGAEDGNGGKNLMTAAWVTQVSSRPNQVLAAVSAGHYTASLLEENPFFTLSVLGEGQEDVAKICGFKSGRNTDKTQLTACSCKWRELPEIEGAAAVLYCEVKKVIKEGDHVLFIGEVLSGETGGKKPLIYDAKYYFG